tara:strand:- start:2484 stop:3536 length:1053 start_codon:yes stop_codon:yes gene_type:complete
MNNIGPLIINLDSADISSYEEDLLKNKLIGGVILFQHNYVSKKQIKKLIDDIKRINSNILISVDHEGGRVQRFKDEFTKLPSFESIGRLHANNKESAENLAYSCGYVAGYELKSIGVDINFSPVVDLSSDSDVLNERTFSSTPQTVSKLASSYISGLIDNGIIPVLKHFPGHGLVVSDTHKEISYSELSLTEIDKHMSVFRDIIDNFHVPIMTSHIKFTNIDSYPVTTSSKWLRDISKNNFKNEIFFISDDLEMSGINKYHTNLSKVEILKQSLDSGCSMAIVTTMQAKTVINKKNSHLFYQSEYFDNMPFDNFKENCINLPCFENIIYNIGTMSLYKDALGNITKYRDI